ncbi:MAG: hypothetical protein HYY04_04510 [Chloroflexi bacterium]|nr:hypothetical protein [Chloroflexota bacterium]
MTKTSVLAGRAGRDDVADLHLRLGHNHPVDQQLDQLPSLLEGRLGQPLPNALAEPLDRLHHAGQFGVLLRLRLQLLVLPLQTRRPLLQINSASLVLHQRHHPAQVRLGQPFQLVADAHPGPPQVLPPRL